jgi:hypothetical protein
MNLPGFEMSSILEAGSYPNSATPIFHNASLKYFKRSGDEKIPPPQLSGVEHHLERLQLASPSGSANQHRHYCI